MTNELTTLSDPAELSPAECIDLIAQVGAGMTLDQIAGLRLRIDFLKAIVREADKALNDFLLEWLDEPGHSLEIGPKRYYIGTKKKTICNNVASTLEALLVAKGGDFAALADSLASQPIKYGAAKGTLGEEVWAEHFTQLIEKDIKTGKPLKVIKEADERFVGKR